MSPNQRNWSKPIRDDMRLALRIRRAVEEHPCPTCLAEEGVGCMTASGSTTTCPERLALIAEEARR